jgi:NAD(P)-dependent dehydrogenase (short-subunit alcohol dehydrogenase family)
MRLQGKTAIVTGAASGIGLAIATLFAQEGASIIAADWNQGRLDAAVAEIAAAGGAITGSQGDISDKAAAEGLTDLAVSTYGGLDILVNNAGVMDHMAGIDALTDDIWRKVMAINVDGPMYASRKAVQHMLEHGGGSIVNINSVAGISGASAGVAYTASKHAMVGMTRSIAWMYAKRGIRCNAISPAGVATNIGETMPQAELDPTGYARVMEFGSLAPAYLEPIDIAQMALFLASDDARYINGAIIPADAGWMAT